MSLNVSEGLVNPCNVKKAADYGEIAASVSHDGNGKYGARFFCACISKAFETQDIMEIIETGLSEIPEDCTYHKVADAVIDFYQNNPDNFRDCYEMLVRDWGYDKYKGVCHIIPNAGVCVLAMLYGKGDFARTVEIATMCGWDTDCNAGNVGTVLGVMCGISGIPGNYRKPINDGIVLSGISGSLNNLDVPSYAPMQGSFQRKTAASWKSVQEALIIRKLPASKQKRICRFTGLKHFSVLMSVRHTEEKHMIKWVALLRKQFLTKI